MKHSAYSCLKLLSNSKRPELQRRESPHVKHVRLMWPKTKSLYNLYIVIVLLQFALFIQNVFHDALICRFLHFLSGLDAKVLSWKDNVLSAHPLKDFPMSLIWNWKFTWYAAVFALIFSNVYIYIYIYILCQKNTSKTSLSKVQWEEWKLQK